MAARGDHGWWPYLGPYALFLVLVEIEARVPESLARGMLLLRVALVGGLFLYFLLRRSYPELRGYRPGVAGLAADVGFGLFLTVLWVGPFLLFPGLPRAGPEDAFDPDRLGAALRPLVLGVRLVGFALITPFVEELFVRSFLIRFVDVVDTGRDFRRVPIARFAWRSFLVTSVWFTLTHVQWEWPVALPTGVLFNLWLYRRRHLGSTIVAHATVNAAIWALVVFGPLDLRGFL